MERKMVALAYLVVISLSLITLCSGSTLYGLVDTLEDNVEHVQLVKIDPVTAKTTPIGHPMTGEILTPGLSAIDPNKGIYYIIGQNTGNQKVELLGLSVLNGSLVFNMTLPFSEGGIIGVGQYLAVDPKLGEVIVIGETLLGHRMWRISPTLNAIKLIGSFRGGDVLSGFCAYDGTNDIIFISVVPSGTREIGIEGYDAHTGQLIHTLQDPFNIEALCWDSSSGLLYGIGLEIYGDTNFTRTLNSLNGKTGELKKISLLDDFHLISSSISALDPVSRNLVSILSKGDDNDTFYFVFANIDTGKVTRAPVACTDYRDCPWSLEYGN